jgi:hypothetical protein
MDSDPERNMDAVTFGNVNRDLNELPNAPNRVSAHSFHKANEIPEGI